MKALESARWDERLAAHYISGVLGVDVVLHDDGTADSMYDLDIAYPDRAAGAVEVTAAADQQLIRLGKHVFDGERWIVEDIAGGWMVTVAPGADTRRVKAGLPDLLRVFEGRGIRAVQADDVTGRNEFEERLLALGVTSAWQSPKTSFPGSIYLTLDARGGMVSDDGRQLVEWLEKWLARPDKADNVAKLGSSGADERHLFILVPSLADAPFDVEYLLMSDDASPPDVEPRLPPEITHLWIVSTWGSGFGMRWAPDTGWSRFPKGTPPGD